MAKIGTWSSLQIHDDHVLYRDAVIFRFTALTTTEGLILWTAQASFKVSAWEAGQPRQCMPHAVRTSMASGYRKIMSPIDVFSFTYCISVSFSLPDCPEIRAEENHARSSKDNAKADNNTDDAEAYKRIADQKNTEDRQKQTGNESSLPVFSQVYIRIGAIALFLCFMEPGGVHQTDDSQNGNPNADQRDDYGRCGNLKAIGEHEQQAYNQCNSSTQHGPPGHRQHTLEIKPGNDFSKADDCQNNAGKEGYDRASLGWREEAGDACNNQQNSDNHRKNLS